MEQSGLPTSLLAPTRRRSVAVIRSLQVSLTVLASGTLETDLGLGGCPPNPALGGTTTVDYTKGPPSQFVAQGNPTYDLNGASFTIGKSGDVPQIASNFYIMFGKLEVTMKAAKGRGIVSSVVMQSDVLDEIDWEWLGANPNEVQTNYFGKGQTTTYNRGAFHPDPGHQDTFRTYTIDWTADQIIWSIEGQTIRVLRQQDAAPGQYPQTPMQIKIGSWSGGDPANAPGTIGELKPLWPIKSILISISQNGHKVQQTTRKAHSRCKSGLPPSQITRPALSTHTVVKMGHGRP